MSDESYKDQRNGAKELAEEDLNERINKAGSFLYQSDKADFYEKRKALHLQYFQFLTKKYPNGENIAKYRDIIKSAKELAEEDLNERINKAGSFLYQSDKYDFYNNKITWHHKILISNFADPAFLSKYRDIIKSAKELAEEDLNERINKAGSFLYQSDKYDFYEKCKNIHFSRLYGEIKISTTLIKENIKKPKSATEKIVFISHSTDDIDFTISLGNLLRIFGLDPFIAHKNIKKSEKWPETIQEKLDTSNVMIIIVSQSIETSAWVNFEVGQFYKKENIHPLFLQEIDTNMSYINEIQGYKLFNISKKDFDREIFHLINNLLEFFNLDKITELPQKNIEELYNITQLYIRK